MISRMINGIGRRLPDFMNRQFTYLPFKYRHGKVYNDFEELILESVNWNEKQLENYIVYHFDNIFQHAKKFQFYRDKYEKGGVLDLVIKEIDDIKKIPILTRSELRENINEFNGYYFEKTGGTSGNPLRLYLDKNVWSREWAHYHSIWKRVGYKYTDAKFVFKRQNVKDKFIKFDFQHNEYSINTYKMSDKDIDEFFKVLITRNIKYFSGYPSSISDFLKEIENKISQSQKEKIQQQIKCCFFSSETPLPNVVNYIGETWNLDFMTCYGHTECCVIAHTEINNLEYTPLHTYGYVEDENNLLLGTSYYNYGMPFIRYKTDDLIRAKRYKNKIIKSFVIKEGRELDYFIDKNDLKIYYLDLFYETQGEIFKYVDYIQVYQDKKGYATLLISQKKYETLDAPSLMNLEKFDVNFDFIYLKEPIRTTSGKVALRIQKLPIINNNLKKTTVRH